jgi:hypothetical protein
VRSWRKRWSLVAQQVGARVGLDQVALLHVIHPVQIGRNEHVRRRPLLDLPGKGGAGSVRDRHSLTCLPLPLGIYFIERVLETGRCEDQKILGLCGGRLNDRHGQRDKGREAETAANEGASGIDHRASLHRH